MSGHTPGPWACSEHKFPLPPFEGALESEWGVYPPLGESGPVAITAGEANARLISSAPDLLEALRSLVADVSGYPAWERPVMAVEKAEAAIAKATGENT